MAHFALICPPFFSHLRVFEAIGAELVARGHRASLLLEEPEKVDADSGIGVRLIGGRGRGVAGIVRAARPTGPLGILRTVADSAGRTEWLCTAAPEALTALGVDVIIGDQTEPAAGLLAAYLDLPLISIACGLPVNAAPGVPSPFVDWPYDPSPKGISWIEGGERVVRLLLARQRRTIESWSARFGISKRSSLEECLSPSMQVAQISRAFDFPRPDPIPFHAVGPIRTRSGEQSLGLGIDPSRPFVFASLGTLQGGRLRLFRSIAKACRALDVQLLVAHCGLLSKDQAGSINADFVTDFVPQQAALAQADLCITHAGLNTVLDAIGASVPLLALPIAFDQPGVAARIVHHRLGERISHRRATPARLQQVIGRLLEDPTYRSNVARQAEALAATGGTAAAVDLIETAAEPRSALVRSGVGA